jgi:dihydrofolate reductase
MITIIAAMDSGRGIGKNGVLPWNLPEEMKFFRGKTKGATIVVGRKTFESFDKELKDREIIILSRSKISTKHYVAKDINEIMQIAAYKDIILAGGGEIYKQFLDLNLVDDMYLTIIDNIFNCDTFFPKFKNFQKQEIELHPETQHNEIPFVIYHYTKV